MFDTPVTEGLGDGLVWQSEAGAGGGQRWRRGGSGDWGCVELGFWMLICLPSNVNNLSLSLSLRTTARSQEKHQERCLEPATLVQVVSVKKERGSTQMSNKKEKMQNQNWGN